MQRLTSQLSAAFTRFEAGSQVLTSNSTDEEWKVKVPNAINRYWESYNEKEALQAAILA